MSLNPVQFGKEVIDQYARHLLTAFSFADEDLMNQLREGLAHPPGREERLARGPYVYLNRPFMQGPGMMELVSELSLHSAMPGIFAFDSLHKHQEMCFRSVLDGRNVLLATGTGSGKTEAFLLPIVQHCLELRDSGAAPGITSLLIYPMNALVNDQLDRLRHLLAGSRITFGRYTGETPEDSDNCVKISDPRRYTASELERAAAGKQELPLPWEECASRKEIRSRLPRILLTNYAQLEYLLLRDRDLGLFRDAPLRFFVMDEIHTYSGSLGSEVACLLRRMRSVCNKSASSVTYIGTSATVTDRDGGSSVEKATVQFAADLFGVEPDTVSLIKEQYLEPVRDVEQFYVPPVPSDISVLLSEILDSVKSLMLADEVSDIPDSILALASKLCGRSVSGGGGSLESLYSLLAENRLVSSLYEIFTEPARYTEAVPVIRDLLGRESCSSSEIQAEMLCYLLLGALARKDDEPLLRPKLHYFVQGLDGVWVTFDDSGIRTLHFTEDNDCFSLPAVQCRSCGQHYYLLVASEKIACDVDGELRSVREVRVPVEGVRSDVASGSEMLLLTDILIGQDEENVPGAAAFLCRHCGSLHDKPGDKCLMPSCRAPVKLIELLLWDYKSLHRCPSCVGRITEKTSVIGSLRSSEVNDVMVLAQTMLSAMQEEELRKVLIFADSRQEAAFQAGWMAKRALRFRVRHLLYGILSDNPDDKFYFQSLRDDLIDKAVAEGLMPARGREFNTWRDRLTWMLLEEFFAIVPSQRRSSLEQLGLAQVNYEGIGVDSLDDFGVEWSGKLSLDAVEYSSLISLVLDVFRLSHAVSHKMLKYHWSFRDKEVRNGIITAPDYYRPQVILPYSVSGSVSNYSKGFRASNGRSAVQVLVKKGLPRAGDELRGEFIDGLWDWFCEKGYLVPASVTRSGQGGVRSVTGLGGGMQIDIDLFRISHSSSTYRCQRCHGTRGFILPNSLCPRYHCKGEVSYREADPENYDVFQYTRMDFVPLHPKEHSAQVPRADRQKTETEFKKAGGSVNCIVATPTLELGVDIGKLEMVMMRNVPPSPANYAQRGGRAGRKHRIGAVFTYCRKRKHDHYFYARPPEMISGSVRIPSFSMQNSPLVRKHVYSMILTELRRLCGSDQEILERAFPTYIRSYLEKKNDDGKSVVRGEVQDFTEFANLLREHRKELLESLEKTFLMNWPKEYAGVVSKPALRSMLAEMPRDLQSVAGCLLSEVKSYRSIVSRILEKERKGERLEKDDRRRMENYRSAEDALWRSSRENYTLSYLARKGLLPGYALFRDSVTASCINPLMNLSRNVQQAIREFTPANLIYANGNEFKVSRLDFYRLQAQDPQFSTSRLIAEMKFDPESGRLIDAASQSTVGGAVDWHQVRSLRLVDVSLDDAGQINDQNDYRFRVSFLEHVIPLGRHEEGYYGTVGSIDYRFLHEERLRLVNLGPKRFGDAVPPGKAFSGFPICSVCGGVRSPFQSQAEIEDFVERHRTSCGNEPEWFTLHSEVISDTLRIGPFEEDGLAVNIIESVLLGATEVLELNNQELEYSILKDENGLETCLLYDPAPGGSGFLKLIMEYWEDIIDRAVDILSTCECEIACYGCLLSYSNQHYHDLLDKNRAVEFFRANRSGFDKIGEIPAVIDSSSSHLTGQESGAEERFLAMLVKRGFPPPDSDQYKINLGGSSYTVADFAYTDFKVAIYIDGLSRNLHGDPANKVRDRRLRAVLVEKGWKPLVISSEGLKDLEQFNAFLEEIRKAIE